MQARYDEETRQLQAAVRSVVTDLVAGSQATPDTKRALLPHVEGLAQFLGSRCEHPLVIVGDRQCTELCSGSDVCICKGKSQ